MSHPLTIGDRWIVGDLLGVGGGGRVWRATDRYTGQVVALKLLRVHNSVQAARVEREVQALRVLQVPGVVRLLDVGEHLGEPYLVMDFVAGERFPGPGVGRDVARVLPRLRELVGVLVQVHRRGLVHRDLKPDNVLVDAAGAVTVLDFGLARGAELGATITVPGSPVGTPRYLAPEQLRGEPVDARTDLYALGVMLFELFAGHPPYPDSSFTHRFVTMVVPPAPALISVAPEVPESLAALVDALLAVDPQLRPASAAHVLQRLTALGDRTADAGPRRLPFVGRERPLVELVVAAHEGRSVGIRAHVGLGRTRLLREVARRLGNEGRTVGFCVPGSRPLESVRALVGEPTTPNVLGELGERLRERVAAGLVVLVDDPSRLDTWSAALLAQVRNAGSVLGLADGDEVLELEPLDERALASLFCGPSRVLHLPEDAAAVLHSRTAGVPARVATQVGAWVAAGLATWEGERIRIDRASLDRLAGGLDVGDAGPWSLGAPVVLDDLLADRLSWLVLAGSAVTPELVARAAELPGWEIEAELGELVRRGAVRRRGDGRVEALTAPALLHRMPDEERDRRHRALASAMPPGAPGRLAQWLIVGEPHEAIAEALRISAQERASGRASQAAVVLLGAWARVRAAASAEDAQAILTEIVRATLEGTTAAQRLEAEAALAAAAVPGLEPLRELLRVGRLAAEGQLVEAEAAARALAPFEDVELEGMRLATIMRSLGERRAEGAEAFAAEVEQHLEPALRARGKGWLGLVRYEQERFVDAAALHEGAAAAETAPVRVARSLVNAGTAWLEVAPERVAALADRIEGLAREHRMAYLEMWALHLRRTAAYRCGSDLDRDEELIAVSASIGEARRHSHFLVVEAAAAWRRGEVGWARRLAVMSAEAMGSGSSSFTVLPRSLAALCGEPYDLDQLVQEADASDRPRLRGQALALLRLAGAPRIDAASLTRWLGSTSAPERLDVLGMEEVRRTLGA